MAEGFVEVDITADPLLTENLVAIFSQLGFEGFWEDEGTLRCYISTPRWSPRFLEEVQTTAALVARSSSSPSPRIHVRNVENRNWNAEWEKTIQPIRVSDRIVVAPSWNRASARPGDIVLTIDPKMSFGTGYHETTRLMLRLMESAVRPGMSMLDIGTGTGVLAIAGMKLGCSSAVACDTDEWSYENACENAGVNGVADRLTVILGDIEQTPRKLYDLVTANIQLNVILPILGEMRARCADGGLLLLSGLLLRDEDEILSSLGAINFTIRQRLTEHEWLALAASRPSRSGKPLTTH
jgi:ribosomal protein L11 methyltransferase